MINETEISAATLIQGILFILSLFGVVAAFSLPFPDRKECNSDIGKVEITKGS